MESKELGGGPRSFIIPISCSFPKYINFPKNFIEEVQASGLAKAKLVGIAGTSEVNVINHMEFGCESFAKLHNLGYGDILLFTHMGDLQFTVVVFNEMPKYEDTEWYDPYFPPQAISGIARHDGKTMAPDAKFTGKAVCESSNEKKLGDLGVGHRCFLIPVQCDFTKHIPLPKNFTPEVRASGRLKAKLIGSGGTFEVSLLNKYRKDTYLLDGGWIYFAKAHKMMYGDFLLFTHMGGLQFTVKVFNQLPVYEETKWFDPYYPPQPISSINTSHAEMMLTDGRLLS